MGFIINKQAELAGGQIVDSIYARVEGFTFHKLTGQLMCGLGLYKDFEASRLAAPEYVEDIHHNDASGMIHNSMSIDNTQFELPVFFDFNLSGSEKIEVEEWNYEEIPSRVQKEIIDYDDDGNEVIDKKWETIKTTISSSKIVEKTLCYNKYLDESSMFSYVYPRIKNIYKQQFGDNNIIDK